MQRSFPKPLHSLWLPSTGLAVLLLGASTPRLAAQQSWNFDSQADVPPLTRYQIPASAGYGAPTYSFPTNPATAGNYAYRINAPAIASDPGLYENARAGAFWQTSDAIYGGDDGNLGRYFVGVDLVAWNNSYVNQLFGVGSLVQYTAFNSGVSMIGAGWASSAFTLAIASLKNLPDFQLFGTSALGETVLNPTHQYRLVLGSWNEANSFGTALHVLRLFDKGNTNTAWQSALGVDTQGRSWLLPGWCGILVANVQAPPPIPFPYGGNTTEGADGTFDNYNAFAPVFGLSPATMPAVVCDTYPPPCGSAPEFNPTILVAIVNQETNLKDKTDIHLFLDGVQIPDGSLNIEFGYGQSGYPDAFPGGDDKGVHKYNPLDTSGGTWPIIFPGATITYPITNNFPPLSVHTNTVTFEDDQNVWHTNSWTWTSAWPYLYASNSLPLGSLSLPGFSTRTVWAPLANMGAFPGIVNCAAGGQLLLDNVTLPSNVKATNYVQKVAWSFDGTEVPGITNFPGLCPTNSDGYDRGLAVQAQAYLQLAAGTNKFHITCRDDVGIYSGVNVTDKLTVMYQSLYNVDSDNDFYVVAEAAGLYPVDIVFQNGDGNPHCYLYSYDSGGNQHLVNDVANGGIPAFYPVPASVLTTPSFVAAYTQALTNNYWNPTNWNLMSSTVVRSNSNYSTTVSTTVKSAVFPTVSAVPAGNVTATTANGPSCTADLIVTGWSLSGSASLSGSGTNTVTCAVPGSATYYRLLGPGSHQILSCVKSNSNLVITYKWQR